MLDDREISSVKYSDIVDLFNKKEFESIIEKIQCLEEDKFEDPFLLNLLGATYLKLNDNKNAKIYFSHAIALEPNHPAHPEGADRWRQSRKNADLRELMENDVL